MNNTRSTTTTTTTSSRTSQQKQQQQQQACAACKHQRKKCGPNCILAPYFPHDRQKQFLNAHKLFGVGKISSMIKPLPPNDRDMAMKTIIFQSDMRAYDPVGGCYRLIQHLESQIEHHTAELQLVLQQLAIFRAQQPQAETQSHHNLLFDPLIPPTTTYDNANVGNNNFDDDVNSLNLYNLGNAEDNNNNLMAHQQCLQHEEGAANFDLNTWIMVQQNQNGNRGSIVDNDQKPMLETASLGIKEINLDTNH